MRRALLAILAIALVALAGCSTQKPQTPNLAQPFIGGTGSLAISYPPGMPPKEIFDAGQTKFSIGVLMENVGESAVGVNTPNPYGYVELIGINPQQFGKNPSDMRIYFDQANLQLKPARRGYDGSVVPGDSGMIEFSGLSYLPNRFGNTNVTVRANACYEYHTYADAQVCIKDNVLENPTDATICVLNGAKQVSSSSGPVQVTGLTENPAGSNKIQVTFTVDNVGKGMVFLPPTQQGISSHGDACVESAGANPYQNAALAKVSLNGMVVNCPLFGGGSQGIVHMYQGSPATISCTITTDPTAGRIYTDSLQITLDYTYLEWIDTPILVRDTNVGFTEPGTQTQ